MFLLNPGNCRVYPFTKLLDIKMKLKKEEHIPGHDYLRAGPPDSTFRRVRDLRVDYRARNMSRIRMKISVRIPGGISPD